VGQPRDDPSAAINEADQATFRWVALSGEQGAR
jgi:hypothetical protein